MAQEFLGARFYDREWNLGNLVICPASRTVRRAGGATVVVHPRGIEVLRRLGEAYSYAVSRGELIDRVWEGNFLVGDRALTKEICLLREAFGDHPQSHSIIKTFPRRGYALLKPLTPRRATRTHRWARVAGIVVLVWLLCLPPPATMQWAPKHSSETSDVMARIRYLVEQGDPQQRENAEGLLRRELIRAPHDPVLLGELANLLISGSPDDAQWPEARRLATAALERQPAQLQSTLVLARVAFFHDWDWSNADRLIQQAQKLAPSDPRPHLLRGSYLLSLGRMKDALDSGRTALALNPVTPHIRGDLAWHALTASRFGESERYARSLLELEPDHPLARSILAKALAASGRREEACEVIGRKMAGSGSVARETGAAIDCFRSHLYALRNRWQTAPHSATRAMVLASLDSELGDVDSAMDHLRSAIAMRSSHVPFLAVDPDLMPLHDHPDWYSLLRAVGYPFSQAAERQSRPQAYR
jgi:DNA-binding winged helix-turn-helix (wHTH) protein/Flp pilus assembly protein TadD